MTHTLPVARRTAPVLVAALLLLLLAFAARSEAASPYPVQTIAEEPGGMANVSLGSDEEGDQIAVWRQRDPSGDWVVESSTRPFGGSWSAPAPVSAEVAQVEWASVAMNAGGEAIAIWGTFDSIWQVEVARLQADGSWSKPTQISSIGVGSPEPKVGIDEEGAAVAVWREYLGNNYGIAATSESAAGTWSTPQLLSDPQDSNEQPALAVDAAGDAVATWGHSTAVEGAVKPAGGSWTENEVIASSNAQGFAPPQVAIDSAGEATAAWSYLQSGQWIVQVSTRPIAGGWSPGETLGEPGSNLSPTVAVAPDGHTSLLWIHDYETIEAAERDAGGSWSSPESLPAPGFPHEIYSLSSATDDLGDVTVASDGFSNEGHYYPLWVNRRLAGGTWSAATELGTSVEEIYVDSVTTDPLGDVGVGWVGVSMTAGQPWFVKAIAIDNSATLTVTKSGAGSGTLSDDLGTIDCGSSCRARYVLGTSVTLTAKPAAGSEFVGWSGGACAGTGTCKMTVDAAKSVGAEFSPAKKPAATPVPPAAPPAATPSASPLRLVKVMRSKRQGTGMTLYWVPGPGRLTVFGNGVKKRTVTVSKTGMRLVKVAPKGAFLVRLRNNHRGFTLVKAKFRPAAGGPVLTQTRRIRLVLR